MKVPTTKQLKALCYKEPRGDDGLEGYMRNTHYLVYIEEMLGKKLYLLYPDPLDSEYYDLVPNRTFNRYFEVIRGE